jgi:outer membrane protein OmpA-like peptidoglycan-associated protein
MEVKLGRHDAHVPLRHAVCVLQHKLQSQGIGIKSQRITMRALENQTMMFGKAARVGGAIGALAYLATACATKTQSGALIGAGAGGLTGAGIGAAVGGGKGALVGGAIGAAAGAGAGALIGNYMDKQEKALKEVKNAKVERQGDMLVVKFSSAILFDTGKSKLKPASKKDLIEFSKVLKEYKETDLVVEGHTDSKGKKASNKKLSLARANAVVVLLQAEGVERSRMKAEGLADDQPVAPNNNEAGRAQNRRVQIQITANQQLQQKQAAAQPAPAQPSAAKR